MQEFLLTLVVIFVLFRVFGEVKSKKSSQTFMGRDEDISPRKKSNFTDHTGDYVDYEEIK